MSYFWYLFAAYTIIWVGLFVYLFSLAGREKRLWDEITALKESIGKTDEARKS